MSNVPLLKRAKSGFQVIDTARDLKKKVLQICIKLPKRYTDLILKDTVQDAKDVARYTRKANSIFPHNQHEAHIRYDFWIHALSAIQALSDDLNDISEIPSVLRYNDNGREKGATINELDEISVFISYHLLRFLQLFFPQYTCRNIKANLFLKAVDINFVLSKNDLR